ncbi:MAG: hypothetical protein H6855_06765 [Rhodospirillales bacterium]|nr:hypothetical protein [Rhodospirillales bacterium]
MKLLIIVLIVITSIQLCFSAFILIKLDQASSILSEFRPIISLASKAEDFLLKNDKVIPTDNDKPFTASSNDLKNNPAIKRDVVPKGWGNSNEPMSAEDFLKKSQD